MTNNTLENLSSNISKIAHERELAKKIAPFFNNLVKVVRDVAAKFEREYKALIKKEVDSKMAEYEKFRQKFQSAVSEKEKQLRSLEFEFSSREKEMQSTIDDLREFLKSVSKENSNLNKKSLIELQKLSNSLADAGMAQQEMSQRLRRVEDFDEMRNFVESKMKEMEKELKMLRASRGGSPRRVFQPYLDDFTADTDGSTKTFYLSREPLKTDTIEVHCTDFPIILRPTIDFTVSGKALTLTSAVDAPSSGATLLVKFYA